MKIKTKLINLVSAKEAIEFIASEINLPGTHAYEYVFFIEDVNKFIKPFSETKNKLIEKYGERHDDGGYIVKYNSSKYPDYRQEMAPLESKEIEIDVPSWLRPDILKRSRSVPAKYFMALKWIFDVTDNVKKQEKKKKKLETIIPESDNDER